MRTEASSFGEGTLIHGSLRATSRAGRSAEMLEEWKSEPLPNPIADKPSLYFRAKSAV